jgi:putative spermidine/putrescine transport system permease protein
MLLKDRFRNQALLSPIVLLLGAAYLLPLAGVLLTSLTEPAPGFGNYSRSLTSGSVHKVLITTFRISIVTTVLSCAIGYGLAWALANYRGAFQRVIFFCVLVPLWTSLLIRTFAWLILLGGSGPVNGALLSLNLINSPIPLMRNEIGVVIGMVHYMIPYAVFTIYAGMVGLDNRVIMAARGLGASARYTFFRVYLPMTTPGLVAAMALVFIQSLGFYVTPAILGGGRIVMIAEYISTQVVQLANWGAGSALAVVLLAAVVITIALVGRLIGLKRMFPGV